MYTSPPYDISKYATAHSSDCFTGPLSAKPY